MQLSYLLFNITASNLIEKLNNFCFSNVKDEDLAENGRETDYHITILANIKQGLDVPIRLLDGFTNNKPIEVELGEISIFENEEYDVLKVEVQKEDLEELHSFLKKNVLNEEDYDEFSPHVTLAYIKKGTCKDLIGNNTFKGIKLSLDLVKYSPEDKNETFYHKLGSVYHKDIGFPEKYKEKLYWWNAETNQLPLKFTNHYLVNEERNKNVDNFLKYVQLKTSNIFEFTTDEKGNIVKAVYRVPFYQGTGNDICFSVSNDGMNKNIITFWFNGITDMHQTLDRTKYTYASLGDDKLKELYLKYKEIEKKYLDSIKFNFNGTRYESESVGLKRATTRAYNIFWNYAQSIGMNSMDVTNYHREMNKQSEYKQPSDKIIKYKNHDINIFSVPSKEQFVNAYVFSIDDEVKRGTYETEEEAIQDAKELLQRREDYFNKQSSKIQLIDSSDLMKAIKLLKSLNYHNFQYKIEDNALVFNNLDDIQDVQKLLTNNGIGNLIKKSGQLGQYNINIDYWDFDGRQSYVFEVKADNKEIAQLQTETYDKNKHGIFDIEVNPNYRRKGLGTQLFYYAKEYLGKKGIELVHSNNLSNEGRAWKNSLSGIYVNYTDLDELKQFLKKYLVNKVQGANINELDSIFNYVEICQWLLKNAKKEQSIFVYLSNKMKKKSMPHVDGKTIDLEIERIPESMRVMYLDDFIKGKKAKDGVYFRDLDAPEQNTIRLFFFNLRKKNLQKNSMSRVDADAWMQGWLDIYSIQIDDEVRKILRSNVSREEKLGLIKARVVEMLEQMDDLDVKQLGNFKTEVDTNDIEEILNEWEEDQKNLSKMNKINKMKKKSSDWTDEDYDGFEGLQGDEEEIVDPRNGIVKNDRVKFNGLEWIVDNVYKNRFKNDVVDLYMPGDPDVTEQEIRVEDVQFVDHEPERGMFDQGKRYKVSNFEGPDDVFDLEPELLVSLDEDTIGDNITDEMYPETEETNTIINPEQSKEIIESQLMGEVGKNYPRQLTYESIFQTAGETGLIDNLQRYDLIGILNNVAISFGLPRISWDEYFPNKDIVEEIDLGGTQGQVGFDEGNEFNAEEIINGYDNEPDDLFVIDRYLDERTKHFANAQDLINESVDVVRSSLSNLKRKQAYVKKYHLGDMKIGDVDYAGKIINGSISYYVKLKSSLNRDVEKEIEVVLPIKARRVEKPKTFNYKKDTYPLQNYYLSDILEN